MQNEHSLLVANGIATAVLFCHLVQPTACAQSSQSSLHAPLADASQLVVQGPLRFLTVDGKTGFQPTSLATQAGLETTLHQQPQGTLSFWFLSLEDLSKYKIGKGAYRREDDSKNDPGVFPLVSDAWPPLENNARFGVFWRTSYPQLIARFDSGPFWKRLDYELAPFVYGELLPLRKRHWYSVVLTWDREAKELYLYVNGQMMGYNLRADGFGQAGSRLYLGSPMMLIRDIRLEPNVLSEAELATRYRTTRPVQNASPDRDIRELMTPQALPDLNIQRDESWQEAFTCSFTNLDDLEGWHFQTSDTYRDQFDVRITDEGLLIQTPDTISTDSRMYLWSPRTFEGDQWIEYDFRLESPEGLSLLVVCASGPQREDFIHDYGIEKMGGMGVILSRTRNYHWEYVRRVECMRTDAETQYVSKNPWGRMLHMGCIPRLEQDRWYRLRLVKTKNRIHGSIDGKTVFDVEDDSYSNNGPVLDFGRIGLRQMYKTKMRYRNFVVFQREPTAIGVPQR